MLEEFSNATGGDSRSYEEWAELRKELLREEFNELIEAIDSRDPARIAQEGSDLTYVISGTFVRHGINLDAAVAEVHRANMSKIGADGRFHVRDDGKVLKGPNYVPPDMSVALPATCCNAAERESMTESGHAIYCEECGELECVHCHEFNARTAGAVDGHARTCPERETA